MLANSCTIGGKDPIPFFGLNHENYGEKTSFWCRNLATIQSIFGATSDLTSEKTDVHLGSLGSCEANHVVGTTLDGCNDLRHASPWAEGAHFWTRMNQEDFSQNPRKAPAATCPNRGAFRPKSGAISKGHPMSSVIPRDSHYESDLSGKLSATQAAVFHRIFFTMPDSFWMVCQKISSRHHHELSNVYSPSIHHECCYPLAIRCLSTKHWR